MYIRFLEQLNHLAEKFSEQCEKFKLWFLLGLSILYLGVTCLLASRRLLWNDELFTLYTSRLPKISDIWSALLTGADQIPPFFHLITRASFWLFGINEVSVRLPEILGFWIMSLCLFGFVSKRSSALCGFVAMLFPFATIAYDYSYEARPYGLVLGFCALSLLCWQSAADGRYRKLSLVGLTLSFAAALSSHYYAILLIFPLATGEVIRSFSRRRLDFPIWIAFGLGLSPLLLFLPLIERSRMYVVHFWSPPKWILLPGCYYFLLAPAILPLVATLIIAALPSSSDSERSDGPNRSLSLTPVHETAAVFGFVAIPLVALILAKTVTEAFTYRYALPSVIGFSILVGLAVSRMTNGRAMIGATFVFFLFVWFISLGLRNFISFSDVPMRQAKTYEFLRSDSEKNLPIVASDLHTFMLLAYYAPRDISARVVYLADPEASLHYLGHTIVDQGILDLRPWFQLNIEKYKTYVASRHRFLVYSRVIGDRNWLGCFWDQPWDLNWLLFELKRADMQIELRGRNKDDLLFLVTH
jgi:hypothetical protein